MKLFLYIPLRSDKTPVKNIRKKPINQGFSIEEKEVFAVHRRSFFLSFRKNAVKPLFIKDYSWISKNIDVLQF